MNKTADCAFYHAHILSGICSSRPLISSALTIDQLLVEIAQHIHEVFTGFLWQDLPREGSLIFVAGKKKHTH